MGYMRILYPELIGSNSIDLDFSIGDKVKRNDGRFDEREFVISSINIKPDTGIVYQGVFFVEGEEGEEVPVIGHGVKDNLDMVEENYYDKIEKGER